MSDFPVDADHFSGGQRLTPTDRSEGGAPLSSLVNAGAMAAESVLAMSGAVDLSASTAAELKTANRRAVTNTGAARVFTLPTFANAPDGWEQLFIDVDSNIANTLTVAAAGADTINGVAGDVVLNSQGEWCKIMKVPGAAGWLMIGTGSGLVPA